MSIRHHLAVSVIQNREQDLSVLLSYMQAAVNECSLMNLMPHRDSAVLLLASQVAYVTGTDTPVRMKYTEHYSTCAEEMVNDLTAVQTSTNVN